MSESITMSEFNMPGSARRLLRQSRAMRRLWLRQGISPRRLALTLALGFAIGCIPVVGIPTLVCAALALALRLNLPAIQAANYAVMPLQLVLIVPFVRLGGWLSLPGRFALAGRCPASHLAAAPGHPDGFAGRAGAAGLGGHRHPRRPGAHLHFDPRPAPHPRRCRCGIRRLKPAHPLPICPRRDQPPAPRS